MFFKNILNPNNIVYLAKRTRTRINDPKPRPSHLRRRILEAATQPFYAEDKEPDYLSCKNIQLYDASFYDNVKNNVAFDLSEITYEHFLAKQVRKEFFNCKMILFFERLPALKGVECDLKRQLKALKLRETDSNFKIMNKAFIGTEYLPILPLFKKGTYIVYSNDMDLNRANELMKSNRHLLLLGGILNQRLLYAKDIQNIIGKNIDMLFSELTNVLQYNSKELIKCTEWQSKLLINTLDTYMEQINKK